MDGSIKIGIDVDIATAEKNAEDLKNKIKEAGNEISKADQKSMNKLANGLAESANKAKSLRDEIKTVDSELLEMQTNADNLRNIGMWEPFVSDSGMVVNNAKEISSAIDEQFQKSEELRNSLNGVQRELSDGNIQASMFSSKFDNTANKVSQTASQTSSVNKETVKATKSAGKLEKATKGVSSSMRSASSSSSKMSNNMGLGVKRIIKYGLALFSIRSIYQMLSRLSRNWLDSDDAAAKQAKSNIEALSDGMSRLLAPVLQTLVGWLSTLMGYANALTKAFFGVELFSAKTNKNISSGASGAKDMAKEVKKLSYSFDEAEVASSNIANNFGGGGGGTGAGDLPVPKIPTPDISGILGALDTIKGFWLGIWNDELFQSMLRLITVSLSVGFESMKSIVGNFFSNVEALFNLMLPNLTVGFDNLRNYWILVLNDMADGIINWAPKITESINTLVDSIFKTFTPMFVWLSGAWADTTGFMLEAWKKNGKQTIDEVGRFIDNVLINMNHLWDMLVDNILTPMFEEIERIWDTWLGDLVGEIIIAVSDISLKIIELINNMQPLIDFVVMVLEPLISNSFRMAWSVIGGVLDAIGRNFKNTFNTLEGILNGFLDFFNGVFTLNWSRAWQGLSNIVSSIFEGLIFIIKRPLNTIISMINGFIRGINKLQVPSWVPGIGGKGVNIPQIPYLARGGVLNKPTLNIAGEAGKEAVVPLENNTGWAKDFLNVLGSYGGFGNQQNEQPQVINLVIDGEVVTSVVNNRNKDNFFDTNGGNEAWNM